MRCSKGEALLREYRLKPESTTRRVLATCCNSAMFLEFDKGHWLSLYRNRFASGAPPIEVRTMTKDKRPDVEFVDDVPSPATHSAGFMWKLLAAWVAMGFRVHRRLPTGKCRNEGKINPSSWISVTGFAGLAVGGELDRRCHTLGGNDKKNP